MKSSASEEGISYLSRAARLFLSSSRVTAPHNRNVMLIQANPWLQPPLVSDLDCEQSLFFSKIRRENERDGMRDIRAASGEAASRE